MFDVETREREGSDHPNPRTNEVSWIGLAAVGEVYLIPMSHPKGVTLRGEHKEKMAAFFYFPEGDERRLTSLGKPSYRMIEYTVAATYAPAPQQLAPDEVMDALRPLMFSDRGKVGHNVKFDLQSIAKYYGGEIPPGPYHDTVLLQHVLNEELQSYDLKTLVCDWYKIPTFKRAKFYPNLGKHGVDRYGLEEVARYLAKDVRYDWLLHERLRSMVIRKKLTSIYDFEMKVYPVLMAMEQAGFPVDLSKMDQVRADLEHRIAEVEQECFLLAGDEFKLSDTGAKRWVLFGEGIPEYGLSKRQLKSQRLPVLSRTPERKEPAVTAEVLDRYANLGNKMATLLAEWSGLEKLRGTFIEGLSKHLVNRHGDLPTIHTGYKQHGTVTGRLSSSAPNLQQLPRGSTIRDLFVAGKGKLLIVADYDQVELRCAAYLSEDRAMLQTFHRGEDIHAMAAAAMYQIPLDKVTPEQRAVGKTQNFAVLYGAGPGKIAMVAGCSQRRAEQLIKGYFTQFPQLQDWMARELAAARGRGDRSNLAVSPPHVVIPPNGRLRRLPYLYELQETGLRLRAERQAINALVQGFASNITKLAMLALSEALPSSAQMLAQVHDEIVIQEDGDVAEQTLSLVREIMGGIAHPDTGQPILGKIPLVASASTGRSWAEAKGKA